MIHRLHIARLALAVGLLGWGPGAAAQHDHDHDHDLPHGHDELHPEGDPELAPETVGDVVPAVRVRDGDAEGLRLEVTRAPLDDAPGEAIRVTVVNEGTRDVSLDAVVVADEAQVRPWIVPRALSAFTVEGERLERCEVAPLTVPRRSRLLAAAALPDRRAAVVAGFEAPPPDADCRVTIAPALAVNALITGEVRLDGRTLAPGERWTSPTLAIRFVPDAWFGLSPLLVAGEVEAADDDLSPLVPTPTAGGGLGLAANPRGLALDLFERDGLAYVWRTGAADEAVVRVINPTPRAEMISLRFGDLGLRGGQACTVSRDGEPIGRFRFAATIPVAPESEAVLTATAAEDEAAVGSPAWEVVVMTPPDVGMPLEPERFAPNDPALLERLSYMDRHGGVVLANHRGRDVLEPIPVPVLARFAPRMFATFGDATTPKGDEATFLERAANVEWQLGLERQGLGEAAWLVCPEAGRDATPIEGVRVGGYPAARGWVVPLSPGLAICAIDLSADELAALVETLTDVEVRRDLNRTIGGAMRKLRAGAPGGLIDALPYERLSRVDLAPADAFKAQQWAVQVPPDGKTTRTLATVEGGSATEDVLTLARPLVFALDVPIKKTDRVAVVVRHAPSRTLEGWSLQIDGTPIGGVRRRAAGADGAPAWIDEILVFGAEEIRDRPRLALALVPEGGVMPLARLAFFTVPSPPGVRLGALGAALTTSGGVTRDVATHGGALRMAGEAFLDGFGLPAGGALEVAVDGRAMSLLARAGVDAAAADDAIGRLRVSVDGRETFVTEPLRAGEPPVPLTIPLGGATRVRIEALDGCDLVDLVDARLIER